MNYKFLLSIVASIGFTASVCAQANILNASTPDQIGKKTEAQLALDNENMVMLMIEILYFLK